LSAIAYAESGNLEQAIERCRQATAIRPAYPEAQLTLGRLLRNTGRLEEAANAFRALPKSSPHHDPAMLELGETLLRLEDHVEAEARMRELRATGVVHPDLHSHLGRALFARGDAESAIASFQEALQLRPDHYAALHYLGEALNRQGRPERALASFDAALKSRPNAVLSRFRRGETLLALGRHAEARSDVEQAIRLDARLVPVFVQRGAAHFKAGHHEAAITGFREVLAVLPDHAPSHCDLGSALLASGKPEEAEIHYTAALRLQPTLLQALVGLGNACTARERFPQAVDCYERVLQLDAGNCDAWNNLSNALNETGDFERAQMYAEKALALRPEHFEAHVNRGKSFYGRYRVREAIACFREALKHRPDGGETLLLLGQALRRWNDADGAIEVFREAQRVMPGDREPGNMLVYTLNYSASWQPEQVFEQHRLYAAAHLAAATDAVHANSREPERRLRIGYVSGDFKTHSVSYFMDGLLRNHDARNFDVICYSNVKRPDSTTDRLRASVSCWRDISAQSDEDVVTRVRNDEVDILVDLSGHTRDDRLSVFSRRPAPVQVNYLGYPVTTGMTAMNYRFTDAIADPPGQTEAWHTETLVRLPRGFLCYTPPESAPLVSSLPALSENRITFGSFNYPLKMSPATVALWARALNAVPGSRLFLKHHTLRDKGLCERFRDQFAVHGIEPARIETFEWISEVAGHLGAYGRIDIALDSFPYNGTTTTCEALWMGVPVLTLRGRAHASRVGASLLTQAGLQEWIAADAGEFASLAADWAARLPDLAALRAGLRERIACSPLCDGPRFVRDLESAYRDMWRRWCAGESARP
jgi:predicted O-linked N-acetylglucosamine transferase (SPINDLY family)